MTHITKIAKISSKNGISYSRWLSRCSVPEFCYFLSTFYFTYEMICSFFNYPLSLFCAILLFTFCILTVSYLCYTLNKQIKIISNAAFCFTELILSVIAIFVTLPLIKLGILELSNTLIGVYLGFAVSSCLWKLKDIHNNYKHLYLFFALVGCVFSCWLCLTTLSHSVLSSMLQPNWRCFCDTVFSGIDFSSDPLGNMSSIALSLMTGCLLIITWSPNQPCKNWNPFTASTLMQSRRTALLAIIITTVMCYSKVSHKYCLGIVCFILLTALDVTVVIFCHSMQDDKGTRIRVAKHILFENRVWFANPIIVYQRISRVVNCVYKEIPNYNTTEQIECLLKLLDQIFYEAKALTRTVTVENLHSWCIAIGFACVPRRLSEKVSLKDTYKACTIIYRHIEDIKKEDGWELEDKATLYDYLLCGIILGMIKLCDENHKWKDYISQLQERRFINCALKHELCIETELLCEYKKQLLQTMSLNAKEYFFFKDINTTASSNSKYSKRTNELLRYIFAGRYTNDSNNLMISEF